MSTDDAKISSKYQKVTDIEHVLKRPDMYIGSMEPDTYSTWVVEMDVVDNEDNIKMIKKNITYVPGFYKIYDELIVNILDHGKRLEMEELQRSSTKSKTKKLPPINHVKNIKITINREEGWIELYNDGDGIDITKHPEYNIYIPELILGNMRSSTNYDDSQESVIGGMNGIGAKACNIFSTKFVVETVDATRELKYKQTFKNNMSETGRGLPKITDYTKSPYTKITYWPDLSKFKMDKTGITKDVYNLMSKRVYDICALTDDSVKVTLNGHRIGVKNFQKYAELYISQDNIVDARKGMIYEKCGERWEVLAMCRPEYLDQKDSGLEHVSFVNGIWTIKGGKHVEHIATQIVKNLKEMIEKKHKDVNIKPQHIKDNLMLFIRSTIVSPKFDSQTKDTLTTPITKFGSKCTLSKEFYNKLFKSDLVEAILKRCNLQMDKTLKKTDGKKQSRLTGIPKLEDAIWAGTAKSSQCSLILTEGDSAKALAVAGLSVVGREKYGVFPLKGKLLNVLDAPLKKIMDNDEITSLKQIIGLENKKEYTSISELRYGRIMIMVDQDSDGSHIKGLIFNLFNAMWPSLIIKPGFLVSLLTPIIKVTKGNGKKITAMHKFYNLTDYENWSEKQVKLHGHWSVKYYKGLGTSTSSEAKEYFKDFKVVNYTWDSKLSANSLNMAFSKKAADDRKKWLENYDRQCVIDYNLNDKDKDNDNDNDNQIDVEFSNFVDKDLKHFSVYSNERAIPSICDGLKRSQRKILFSCFKRNLIKEIKVAQLAGYVSEHSGYHHGEASLQGTIIGLAQNYMGSNNINLLMPNGQFGTRLQNGADAASARYIYTELNPIVKTIYNKDDFPLLSYRDDDGQTVEPDYYLPVIPMILVNGIIGIGTGYSTNIPNFNPKKLSKIIRRLLEQDKHSIQLKNSEQSDNFEPYNIPDSIKPYYHGFKGTIEKYKNSQSYISRGVFKAISTTKVEITELPIHVSTQDYKEFLETAFKDTPNDKDTNGNTKERSKSFLPHKIMKNYESYSTETHIKFVLEFDAVTLKGLLREEDMSTVTSSKSMMEQCAHTKFEKVFKLVSSHDMALTNMTMFNSHDALIKSATPKDIIQKFYTFRLGWFQKRKDNLLQQYNQDLVKIGDKVRFILDIIEGRLEIKNTPKADVDKYLRNNKYNPNQKTDGFEHLTGMAIHSLTREKKEELLKDQDEIKQHMAILEKKTKHDLWLEDLDNFDKAYQQYIKDDPRTLID
jgi:DNA topoisomerase-2